jgi:hypothetical protein
MSTDVIIHMYPALFVIVANCVVKVGKTPATQNLALEKYAVKIGKSTLFLYDKILIYHDCDFKKMRIQKLLNRVEKYRWIFLWTTRHKSK